MIIDPDDYLREDDVLARWPHLTRAELRRATKANPPLIGFYAFRGGPCFTPCQVQEYIDRTYLRAASCPAAPLTHPPSDSKSATIISTGLTASEEAPITPAGMTPEAAAHAAKVLAQRMKSRPRSRSPRSLPPAPRDPKGKPRLALIKSSS
jgi:hypothetical protein